MKSASVPIVFLVGLFSFGCDDEQSTKRQNCIESVLEEHHMIPYTGEDLGCKFFITLFEFNGEQYFQLGNHCADMVTYPFDCKGNQICAEGATALCSEFYRSATYMDIVGMDPD
jgi:hypothetical protein